MITEQFVFFDSNFEREGTSRLTGLIVVKVLAVWTGIVTVIHRVSHCGGKRGRTSGQARAVPIQVPTCSARVIAEVSVNSLSVFVRSIATISAGTINSFSAEYIGVATDVGFFVNLTGKFAIILFLNK